jgi:RNA polymerase sigma-70 factor (ECF subfamily)
MSRGQGRALKKSDIGLLFDRYGPLVYRRARALLGSHEDAQEATQEVFIAALRGSDRFEHRSGVHTWLVRITTNYCLNVLRNRNRRARLWDEHQPRPQPGWDCGPSPEQRLQLQRLLAEADEKCAQAVVYVHIDGCTHAEAAELLGVSRRTVGNLLERFNRFAMRRLNAGGEGQQ